MIKRIDRSKSFKRKYVGENQTKEYVEEEGESEREKGSNNL
jgi:hypothetical protein